MKKIEMVMVVLFGITCCGCLLSASETAMGGGALSGQAASRHLKVPAAIARLHKEWSAPSAENRDLARQEFMKALSTGSDTLKEVFSFMTEALRRATDEFCAQEKKRVEGGLSARDALAEQVSHGLSCVRTAVKALYFSTEWSASVRSEFRAFLGSITSFISEWGRVHAMLGCLPDAEVVEFEFFREHLADLCRACVESFPEEERQGVAFFMLDEFFLKTVSWWGDSAEHCFVEWAEMFPDLRIKCLSLMVATMPNADGVVVFFDKEDLAPRIERLLKGDPELESRFGRHFDLRERKRQREESAVAASASSASGDSDEKGSEELGRRVRGRREE